MNPDLTLAQLRHFVLVAESRSYRVAAGRAYRTQPAISLSVKELERKLGEPLLERAGKVALTPLGRYCLPRFKSLLEHYDRVSDEVTRLVQKKVGRVSIAAVPSVASRLLPVVVQRILKRYPEIQISIQDDTAEKVQALVQAGRVDFGIANLWHRDADLHFEPLWRDPVGLVCRDDHPLVNHGQGLPWKSLVGYTLIRNGTTRLLSGTAAEPYVQGSPLYVSNMVSLIAMLEAGVAATTLPFLAVPENNARLRFLALVDPGVEREVGLLQTRDSTLSPAAKALKELVMTTTENLRVRPDQRS